MKRKGKPLRNSTVSASDCTTATAGTSDNNKRLQKVLRALVIFSGDAPARDLFAEDMVDEITKTAKEVSRKDPLLPAGAARNKALKKLWDNADQSIWDAKAASFAEDIEAYVQLPVLSPCQTYCTNSSSEIKKNSQR